MNPRSSQKLNLKEEDDDSQKGENKATKGGVVYGDYLQVKSGSPQLPGVNVSFTDQYILSRELAGGQEVKMTVV